MFFWSNSTVFNKKVSAHAQVDQEFEVGKMKDEIFRAPTHIQDLLSLNLFFELFRRWGVKRTRPVQIGGEDRPVDETGL